MADDFAPQEPAAAAAELGSTSGPPDRVRSEGGRVKSNYLPVLAAWLVIVIAGAGMFFSTPPSAGPDEPTQAVTAWYLSGHGFHSTSTGFFSVPASLWVDPCFAKKSETTAGCMPPRSSAETMVPTSLVLNYPPPYYWVVGAGQRLAASLAGVEYADIGGRLASLILNFGTLLLLTLKMRRRNQLWGTFLLLVSTPMAVFMGIVVNPNGWEITCGLVMAAVLWEVVGNRQPPGSNVWPRSTTLLLVAASVALALSRPLGFVWDAGLAVSAAALAPSINRRLAVHIACAVAPGIVLGLLWSLAYPTLAPASHGDVGSPPPVLYFAAWFAVSVLFAPQRLYEMFGVLGWLDTSAPAVLFLTYLVAWAVVLIRLLPMRKIAIVCGIFGIVVLPGAIETIGWGSWPWWQGRYTLPFAAGFALLLLLRSGRIIPRTISIVASLSTLSLGLMVWVNALRYGFGLNPLDLPASLANPGLSTVRLVLSAAVGSLLVLLSGYQFLQARRLRPDRSSGRWLASG
jgi:hypothetical protein